MESSKKHMTVPQGIALTLCRSYRTALALLGDEAAAEALVAEAICSLDPNSVTDRNLRNAVVARLVQLKLAH
jgi:hypothetical protein